MTPLSDEQPLSRRQLREQQRTTDSSAPAQAPSRRVSTTSPVTGGDIPEVNPTPQEPNLSTNEVAVLEEAEASGQQLTRRQARNLERVRTASVSVIEPNDSKPSTPSKPAATTTTPSKGAAFSKTDAPSKVDAAASDPETESSPNAVEATQPASAARTGKKSKKRDQSTVGRLPSFVPSSASSTVAEPTVEESTIAEPDIVDAEIVSETDAEAGQAAFDLITARHPESAFGPAVSAQGNPDDSDAQLASGFGSAVLDAEAPDESQARRADEPFDQIIARGLEEAGSGVSTSSIILPIMPNSHPLTGPLSANGSVVVTGSIDLPSGMGSSGGNPDHFDKSDIDAMFDAEDEARPATAGTPVSASKAVSTHTATRDVITPPTPARSNRLLLILAITAGVLAVAVLAVIIVGIAAGAFQSR